MGIIPVPINPGAACNLCFAPGQTPTLLKVFFGAIKRGSLLPPGGPAPPNGYFDFLQWHTDACRWVDVTPVYAAHIDWEPGSSDIAFTYIAVGPVFGQHLGIACKRYFLNAVVNPIGTFYYGGFAFICTPAEMQAWIEMVTPITGPDPRMELFPMDNDEIVLKFCDKQSATNVKIKVDTALL